MFNIQRAVICFCGKGRKINKKREKEGNTVVGLKKKKEDPFRFGAGRKPPFEGSVSFFFLQHQKVKVVPHDFLNRF